MFDYLNFKISISLKYNKKSNKILMLITIFLNGYLKTALVNNSTGR